MIWLTINNNMTKIEQLISDWRTRARHCALIHAELEKNGNTVIAKQALAAKDVYMTCARNLEALSAEVINPPSLGSSWPIF